MFALPIISLQKYFLRHITIFILPSQPTRLHLNITSKLKQPLKSIWMHNLNGLISICQYPLLKIPTVFLDILLRLLHYFEALLLLRCLSTWFPLCFSCFTTYIFMFFSLWCLFFYLYMLFGIGNGSFKVVNYHFLLGFLVLDVEELGKRDEEA